MFVNGLVAVVKAGQKPLREFKDVVYLPSGTEYELGFKNTRPQRVRVSIQIDGQSIGSDIVIGANSEATLERFTHSLTAGNRFKFIERTREIENHRGARIADGLIEIKFEYEQVALAVSQLDTWQTSQPPLGKLYRGVSKGITASCDSYGIATNSAGITVGGSKSDQKFNTTLFNGCGTEWQMTIQLLCGSEPGTNAPVTTDTTLECSSCGFVSPATAKFCSRCGTALETFT